MLILANAVYYCIFNTNQESGTSSGIIDVLRFMLSGPNLIERCFGYGILSACQIIPGFFAFLSARYSIYFVMIYSDRNMLDMT